MKITRVLAREIFDAGGYPALQCEIQFEQKFTVVTSVGCAGQKKSVQKAIKNIELDIAPLLLGQESNPLEMDLAMIELDGTHNRSNLGVNAIFAVSMALYKAQALAEELELYELLALIAGQETVALPSPLFSIIKRPKDPLNAIAIKNYLSIPLGAQTFRSALEAGIALHHQLNKTFIAPTASTKDILNVLTSSLTTLSLIYGHKAAIALELSSNLSPETELQQYSLNGSVTHSQDVISWYSELISSYPICALIDPLAPSDLKGLHMLANVLGDKVQIIGDELFASSPHKISNGVDQHLISSVILRPDQIGTITETLQLISLCHEREIDIILATGQNETEETFLADLSVGMSVSQIKTDSCLHSENMAKYNRLLAIEDSLTVNMLER